MTAATHHIEAEGRMIALVVRVNPRARHIGLRVPPDGSPVRLTVPSPRLMPQALAFAEARSGWILARLNRQARVERPFAPGVLVPVGGRQLLLLSGSGRLARLEGDALVAGGDGALFSGRVRRWLVAEAARVLEQETRCLAMRAGLKLAAVRVADPRSRWGSCAADGRIAYSWRLILAPDFVRRSVVAHEVAHLAEQNHGPDFWALAGALLGESHAPARAWLKAHGAGLHGWGRGV